MNNNPGIMSLTARSRPSLIPFAMIVTVIALNAVWYYTCVVAEPVNSPKIVWTDSLSRLENSPSKDILK